MFLSGLASVLCPLANSYWGLVLYVVVIGILDGSYIGLMSIVTLDIVGLHKISSAWSILFFCQSFTYLLGPPAAGTLITNNLMRALARTSWLLKTISLRRFPDFTLRKPTAHKFHASLADA